MNIKDFLIQNYVWIILVIVLTIVTIIGFLADKKRTTNKKDKEGNGNNQLSGTVPVGQPLNYQQPNNMNNGMVNNGLMGGVNNQNNGVMPNNNNLNNNMMNNNPINQNTNTEPQPMPINPINQLNPEPMNQNNNATPEPIYQPLSEQKPVIAPVDPIQNINNMRSQNNINNNINQSGVSGNMPNTIPTPVAPVGNNSVMPGPIPMNPGMQQSPSPMPNINMPNTMPQPMSPPANGSQNFVFGPQQNQNNNNQPM